MQMILPQGSYYYVVIGDLSLKYFNEDFSLLLLAFYGMQKIKLFTLL